MPLTRAWLSLFAPRASQVFLLSALLLLACGNNTDPAPPGVSDDPTLEVDPVEADGVDAGPGPRQNPNPVPIGSRSDAGKSDASTPDGGGPLDGGAVDAQAGDARAEELGAFSAVERLLVADGKSARVHVLDVPTREYLDTLSLSAAGAIYAGADGRYGYVLESAQNQVQVINLGLPDPAEAPSPKLIAPSLLRVSFTGISPSAFGSHGEDVAVLFAGSSQVATFNAQSLSSGAPTRTGSVSSAAGVPTLLFHLGDRLVVSERDASSGESQLRVLDDKLSPLSSPDLVCVAPEGSAQATATIAVGCADGILLWNTTETSAKTVRYPGSVGSERAHRLVASPSDSVFMTLLGDKLCLLRDEISCVNAPTDAIDYIFDPTGKRALVLSRDGTLHLLDGETLEKRDTLTLFSPLDASTPAAELPGLAVGRRNTYVSDPGASRIHIVDSIGAKDVGRIDIPAGFPTQVVVFKYGF